MKKKSMVSFIGIALLFMFLSLGPNLLINQPQSNLMSSNDDPSINTNGSNESEDYSNSLTNEEPQPNEVGQEEWWNASFAYRMQINVTNPGADDIVNGYTYVTFNYTDLVLQGKMNESLKDVRIVENGVIRSYYIQKDFPELDYARVWFKINCSASSSDFDTFMYYGNNSVEADSNLLSYNPMGVMWQTFDSIYTDPSTGSKYILDSSQGNDGIIENNPQLSTDAIAGKSMYFGGDNDPGSINLGNPTDLQISGDQTIVMWVKPQQLYNRQNPYAKAYGGEGTITLETSGSFSYYYGTAGSNAQPYQGFGSGTGTAAAGQWVHIAIVRDLTNGQLRWYKNGILQAQTSAAYSYAQTGSLSAFIGRGYVSYFWGNIDELHIYNTALPFVEIQRLYNYRYSCTAELFDEVEQGAQVELTVRDIDGRPVQNAKVSLYNSTGLAFTSYSDEKGLAIFSTIPYDYYNVTVNYTLPLTGEEQDVFNGNATNGYLHFTGLYETKTLYVNLWSIDFSVLDYDSNIMDYGYVLVYKDNTKTQLLANLTLEQGTGKQIFTWLNASSYYYEVYYLNGDYKQSTVLLDNTTITRTDLSKKITYNINETSSGSFYSTYTIYADGSNSSYIGPTRMINATINITQIVDSLSKVDLYYINSLGQEIKIIDASKTYTTETEDVIDIQLMDNFDAYGLKIDIFGDNNTQNNGYVKINYTQATAQQIKADLSKVSIKIIDETNKDPVSGVVVHIYNGTIDPANNIANLTTDSLGYAYGTINENVEFWYTRGTYNFTLEFFSDIKFFNVNYTDPGSWNASNVNVYNYTVTQQSTMILEIRIDVSQFQTHIYEENIQNEVTWGNLMTFSVNFTYSTPFETDQPLTDPDTITCTIIGSITYSAEMTHIGSGIFSITVNSSMFSAGTAPGMLTVKINGSKAGYAEPNSLLFLVTLNPIDTSVSLHDYDNGMKEIDSGTISQYYNEKVNISIAYFLSGQPENKISGATLSYYWDYGSDTNVREDPINPGYYTFTVDTGTAPNIGKYGIYITISLENYTYATYVVFIDIQARPTTLNTTNTDTTQELLRISKTLNESDSYLFNFTYREVLGDKEAINDTDYSYFTWDYTTGEESGIGELTLLPNGQYQLDFNTSTRDVGDYILLVTLSKSNYEQRQAMIFLTIEKRIINYELTGDFNGVQLTKYKGDQWNLTAILKDQSRSFTPLTTATVTFSVSELNYSINLEYKENGIYQTILEWDNIKSIFKAGTYAATLTMTNDTFATVNLDITLIIENRTADLTFKGGFSGAQITEVKGDTFEFTITLIDKETGQPIENAQVSIYIPQIGKTIELEHQGNGVYSATTDFTDVKAFYRDASFQGILKIQIENYDIIEENIAIKIKMEEISPGVPTFYVLMGVAAVGILVGTLVGYKVVQNARIPAFIKLINKVEKEIKAKKEISPSPVSVSYEQELIEKFGDLWQMIDLNLDDILKEMNQDKNMGNLAPGDMGGL